MSIQSSVIILSLPLTLSGEKEKNFPIFSRVEGEKQTANLDINKVPRITPVRDDTTAPHVKLMSSKYSLWENLSEEI